MCAIGNLVIVPALKNCSQAGKEEINTFLNITDWNMDTGDHALVPTEGFAASHSFCISPLFIFAGDLAEVKAKNSWQESRTEPGESSRRASGLWCGKHTEPPPHTYGRSRKY
jgi:hypothetical protein